MPAKEVVIVPAPDAERIARPLIERHHTHLLDAQVLFLHTTQERKRKGKHVYATAQKLSDLDRYLSSGDRMGVAEGYDFLILISHAIWERLDLRQKAALMDHELSHCLVDTTEDGERVLSILGHDVEEFGSVLARHGLVFDDVKAFAEIAANQLRLPLSVVA